MRLCRQGAEGDELTSENRLRASIVALAWYASNHCAESKNAMKMLDVVAVLQDFPAQQVVKGQVGTVVEELDADHVLVEFADANGITYAIKPIPVALLMKLEYSPTRASGQD